MHLHNVISPKAGEQVLSLLPPWHMYERAAEYFTLAQGVKQVYTAVPRLKVRFHLDILSGRDDCHCSTGMSTGY